MIYCNAYTIVLTIHYSIFTNMQKNTCPVEQMKIGKKKAPTGANIVGAGEGT